ncbi:MAG: hypothetical protein HYR84_09020 [Planctomycetes bacterium]|nr:hypothetical protein [Planctomycetota bacterium]
MGGLVVLGALTECRFCKGTAPGTPESGAGICPYCNAVLPPLTATATAAKLPCPRCGELVPADRWTLDRAVAHGAPPQEKPVEPTPTPGIRQTAWVVVAIMVTTASIGLGFMLWTVNERRARDPRPLLDPIKYCKPIDLKGLAYLPKDADAVAGIHLAEWLDDKKVGKPLLDEPRPVPLHWLLMQLPRVSGLPIEEIDHVAMSAKLDALQLTLVVKTRRAYSLEKIAESARRSDTSMHQGKPVYEVSLPPWAEAMVWCVEEKTLVCVIRLDAAKVEHLNGLSATPRPLDEALPGPLLAAIRDRLPRRQLVWAVGRLDKMKEVPGLVPMGKNNAAIFKEIKVFALGLEPGDDLTLTGDFLTSDAKSAERLKTFLDGVTIPGAKSQKVVAPPPDKGAWLTWQVRGDVATMRQWLNRGQELKK